MISNLVTDTTYDLHHHRRTEWNDTLMTHPPPPTSSDLDGTVRPIYRPQDNQRIIYNGHKRVHALKYLSIWLACGMIGNMYGPVGNKNHIII